MRARWYVTGAVVTATVAATIRAARSPRVARTVHVWRGRPIAYRVDIVDGTLVVGADARLEDCSIVGGTTAVRVTTTPQSLCAECFEDVHGWEPDMGDAVEWAPGSCDKCPKDGHIVFTVEP